MHKFWEGKNVFITGCTGLLGSWLTQALFKSGANTVGLVRDWVPRSNLNRLRLWREINIVWGDIIDYTVLERALNEYEIDTVFHLAAQTIVGIANRSPLSTFESNIKGTWNILEAARHIKTVERIVVASSDKAYGSWENLPYNESVPLRGLHPYDVSKSCTDLIAQTYYHTYHLPVGISRCGNLYGGGDLNFNRIVPGTIRSVLMNERPIIRSDGTFIRDYFYVLDAVQANLLLAERLNDPEVCGEAFNFSNEKRVTVSELVNLILKLMDRKDLKPEVLGKVKEEIKYQYLTAKKARNILKWETRYTLEEGLEKTIIWYRKFFKDWKNRRDKIKELDL